MKDNLKKLLDAREAREMFEQKIMKENFGCTLITIRANYAGENKNTMYAHLISYLHFLKVQKKIHAKKIFHSLTFEGLIFFILTDELPHNVKWKMILIEENFFLGRLADIDVRTEEKIFSRTDINMHPRKCLLCDNAAVLCVRNRTHSTEDVLKKTVAMTEQFFTSAHNMQTLLSHIARASMLEELCREVSLGCVTVNSNGSHPDMNFLLMLQGVEIVCEAIKKLRKKNIKDFAALRAYGINFEKKLLANCGGVNTYKGAHFLLLILSAAVLRTKNFSCLKKYIADFSAPCLLDITQRETNGKLKYLGIRGEVASGFEHHFEIFLPLLESGASSETLTLNILQHTYDTTTIKRGGIDALNFIRRQALNASTYDDITALDKYCVDKNISTGGVADNFIVTYALFLIKKYIYRLPG